MRTLWPLVALATPWIGGACAPPPDGSGDATAGDAAPRDAAVECDPARWDPASWVPSGEPRVELGTGRDRFESFEDGATLGLVSGCQGAQHIWTSVRARGLDPQSPLLEVAVRRDSDGLLMSQVFRVRVSLEPVACTDYAEVVGLTVVIPEPDLAIGEDLTMRVAITDREERTASVVRPIRTEWATEGHCF
ncbi:MAG TPA: hypothetical protein VIL20_01045 [Sandaracinaceae bacterium]